MVMDNLEVEPIMSTMSIIALFNKLSIKEVGSISEEKVIQLGMAEVNTFCSDSVGLLAELFMPKKKKISVSSNLSMILQPGKVAKGRNKNKDKKSSHSLFDNVF
ncbi:hypothetical protein LINGRAHAP2_LOCUS19312 [Linum grandiflorum]